MDTLPLEVIRHIFLEAIETGNDPWKSKAPEPHIIDTFPFALSHVCRSWRNMTLSFGELWSYLSFSFDYENDYGAKSRENSLEIFETCLRRTLGCPLNFSIWIDFDHIDIDVNGEGVKDALRKAERIVYMMFSQQQRWQDVTLLCLCRCLSMFPQDIRADNMPLLRSLHLSFHLSDEEEHTSVVIDIAKSTRLKCLRLYGQFLLDVGENLKHSLTEWSELDFQEPTLRSVARSTCLDLLKVAPNLSQLRVSFSLSADEDFPAAEDEVPDDVMHHDLRAFRFCGCTVPFTRRDVFFRSLNAFCLMETYGALPERLLADAVGRFTPSLTFLSIGVEVKTHILIETICLLPALRVLQTIFNTASELMPFLKVLTIKDTSDADVRTVCSSLRSLRISMPPDWHDQKQCIAVSYVMLESRRRILNTFQRIRISAPVVDEATVIGRVDYVLEMPLSSEAYAELEKDLRVVEEELADEVQWMLFVEGHEIEPDPFGR